MAEDASGNGAVQDLDRATTRRLIAQARRKHPFSTRRAIAELKKRADAARDGRAYAEAADLYEAVLTLEPDNGPLHVQSGHMYKEAGRLGLAEAHYLQARIRMPGDGDLHLQLGHFYKVTGRHYEAMAAYKRAAALMPGAAAPRLEIEALGGELRRSLRDDGLMADDAAAPEPPAALRRLSAEEVRRSGLFDPAWYGLHYPDIVKAGFDPLAHYVARGTDEGRSPGPDFDAAWYRGEYPEVGRDGLDPLAHYLDHGKQAGFKPKGPPRYTRWVEAFDTLDAWDRDQIAAHREALGLEAPLVVVAIGAIEAELVGVAIRSLRRQLMRPSGIVLLPTPGCSAEALRTARAMAGSDRHFDILDAAQPDLAEHLAAAEPGGRPAPILLMDAAAELREHATYMFVQAWREGVELIYSDEDRRDGEVRTDPTFKPAASPELLRHADYPGRCVLLRPRPDLVALVRRLGAGTTTIADEARAAFGFAGPDAVARVPFVLFHDEVRQDSNTRHLVFNVWIRSNTSAKP